MSPATKLNTLSGIMVRQAMRRQIIHQPQTATIANAIACLIKFKVNALMVADHRKQPVGVISKTDIMGAYYAGLPTDTPLEFIMNSPLLFCTPDESLERALETMRSHKIYRLYVKDMDSDKILGTLAYPDIVGILYQYCHQCPYSKFNLKRQNEKEDARLRYLVKEVMTPDVKAVDKEVSLTEVMEEISLNRFGAMLITDQNKPCGVISKTDLVLNYKHGLNPETKAEVVMSSPVRSCDAHMHLEDAIKEMILFDIQRLFIHQDDPEKIVGVLSLSDTARSRSGSCHACISSRIKIDE
jgi:predicted transcriptional regulator